MSFENHGAHHLLHHAAHDPISTRHFTNYGTISVLHGASFRVEEAEIVTLIGANCAGKASSGRALEQVVRAG